MKIISINENKTATMFEVKYPDGVKFIIIPTLFLQAFEYIFTFGFNAGGAGEFENEFPSQEDKLKAYHKAFQISPRSKRNKVQVWSPDDLNFTTNSLTNVDDSNPLIKFKLDEWWKSLGEKE